MRRALFRSKLDKLVSRTQNGNSRTVGQAAAELRAGPLNLLCRAAGLDGVDPEPHALRDRHTRPDAERRIPGSAVRSGHRGGAADNRRRLAWHRLPVPGPMRLWWEGGEPGYGF